VRVCYIIIVLCAVCVNGTKNAKKIVLHICCSRIDYSRPNLQLTRGSSRRDVTITLVSRIIKLFNFFHSFSPIPASRCFCVVSDNTAPAIAATSTERDRKTRTRHQPDNYTAAIIFYCTHKIHLSFIVIQLITSGIIHYFIFVPCAATHGRKNR